MAASPLARRLGLLTLYLSWGSTYPVMRVALRTMPPLLLLSGRCAVAGVILLVVARLRGAMMPTLRQWGTAAVIGGTVLGLGHGLTTWGIQHVEAGVAALLVSMVSVWLAVLSWGLLGERPTSRTAAGLLVGFVGLAFVATASSSGGGRSGLLAVAALVASPLAWALGSILSRRVELPTDPIMSTAAQLLACAPMLFTVSVVAGEPGRAQAFSGASLAAFLYLAVCGYVAGFAVYTWMLQVESITIVGTYAYVNPLVAVALGAVFLGESLSWAVVIGGVVILAGVALVVMNRAEETARIETDQVPAAPVVNQRST